MIYSRNTSATTKSVSIGTTVEGAECRSDDSLFLDNLLARLNGVDNYAYDLLQRATSLVDRVFREERVAGDDCATASMVGLIHQLNQEVDFIVAKLSSLDHELRRLSDL